MDAKGGKSIKVSVKFLEDQVKYCCPIKNVKNSTTLEPGDTRLVKWSNGEYYKAKILSVGYGGSISVKYLEDNIVYKTNINAVKDSRLQKGDIRRVKWKDGKVYSARIIQIDTEDTMILYNTRKGKVTNNVTDEKTNEETCKYANTHKNEDTNKETNENADEDNIENINGDIIKDTDEDIIKELNDTRHEEDTDEIVNKDSNVRVNEDFIEMAHKDTMENTAHDMSENTNEDIINHTDEDINTEFNEPRHEEDTHEIVNENSNVMENEDSNEMAHEDIMENTPKDTSENTNEDTTRQHQDSNETANSNLLIGLAKSKPGTKRIWDKKDSCIFCETLVTNFTRHIIRNHSNELEVGKILAKPKASKDRRIMFDQLRKKGNFHHNKNCIREQSGSLIVVHRPTETASTSKYLPCKFCLGFFSKKILYRHMKDCNGKTENDSSRNAQSSGSTLLLVNSSGAASLRNKIFPIMRNDKISKAAQQDPLICEFGYSILSIHKEHHMKQVISQKMRELGRLKLELKSKIQEKQTHFGKMQRLDKLQDFLDPQLYNEVVECVHSLSGFDEETGKFEKPSLAMKLGFSLKKCAEIVESIGMTTGNSALTKKAKHFRKLLPKKWKYDVSINASKTLSKRKWNKPSLLPFAEDIKLLNSFLAEKEDILLNQLKTSPTEIVWRELAEVSLTRIILLNRRRSGEAQRITTDDYLTVNKPSNFSDSHELLSDTERMLCKSFTRFEIEGKRGRAVPVLLTKSMRKNMDLLMKTRDDANINVENPYFFAIANTPQSCLRGTDVLRKYAVLCGAKYPKNIRSTQLRKHVATMSQILNLSASDIESLAIFLGHSVEVHKEYYRLPDDVSQMAKISKLLLALESGKIKELKGQNFDTIDVNCTLSDIDESDVEDEVAVASTSTNSELNPVASTTLLTTETAEPTVIAAENKVKIKKRRATSIKRPWSEIEKNALIKHFQKHIILKRVPNKAECESLLHEENCFNNRSWSHIKFQVKNMFNKCK